MPTRGWTHKNNVVREYWDTQFQLINIVQKVFFLALETQGFTVNLPFPSVSHLDDWKHFPSRFLWETRERIHGCPMGRSMGVAAVFGSRVGNL